MVSVVKFVAQLLRSSDEIFLKCLKLKYGGRPDRFIITRQDSWLRKLLCLNESANIEHSSSIIVSNREFVSFDN